VADPKIHASPPHVYQLKFGSSAAKSVRINRTESQNGEHWAPPTWSGSVADPKNKPQHICVTNICVAMSDLVVQRSVYA